MKFVIIIDAGKARKGYIKKSIIQFAISKVKRSVKIAWIGGSTLQL